MRDEKSPENTQEESEQEPRLRDGFRRLTRFARERAIYSACALLAKSSMIVHFSVPAEWSISEWAWHASVRATQRAHTARIRCEAIIRESNEAMRKAIEESEKRGSDIAEAFRGAMADAGMVYCPSCSLPKPADENPCEACGYLMGEEWRPDDAS